MGGFGTVGCPLGLGCAVCELLPDRKVGQEGVVQWVGVGGLWWDGGALVEGGGSAGGEELVQWPD